MCKKYGLKNKVFKEVSKIQKGKTKSYKQIANKLTTNPRAIARILSQNKHPIKIPCHRVICSNNKIGGYTFKGKLNPKLKIRLLKKEGVRIKRNKIINLQKAC